MLRWAVALLLLAGIGLTLHLAVAPSAPVTVAPGAQPPHEAPAARVGPPPTWARVAPEQLAAAEAHAVPVAFENDHGMRFVLIPAGTVRMGSPSDELGRRADEALREVVLAEPYYMQVTEATNGQLRREHAGWTRLADHHSGSFLGRSLDGDDQPAVRVSWEEAAEFARRLSERDSARSYFLPTEAQWEHACRAGTRSPYPWGTSVEEGARHANANDDRTSAWLGVGWGGWPRDDGRHATAPVASYPPNGWGLHDMIGNVWEWCGNGVDRRSRGSLWARRPMEPGPRALRGGSWLCDPTRVRSAARATDMPHARSINVGFRLVSPLPVR